MKKPIAFILSLFLALAQQAVHGAEDGKSDSASEGQIRIELQVVPSLQIETVDVLDLAITNRSVDAHFEETFCVTGTARARYSISAYGSGTDTQFVLTGQAGNRLEYELFFDGSRHSAVFDRLLPGKASPVYEVFSDKSACNDTTAFRITFRAKDLQSAEAGLYTGHLTLVVSPV